MKTLIIHPADITTDFLKYVWKDKLDYTVVRSNIISKTSLRKMIKEHDKIICMGHGSEQGLFGKNRLIIDSTLVQLLRQKTCVFIWCNANVFFEKYKLKGLCSGMIISEYEEAIMCCVPFASGDVKRANEKLANVLSEALHTDPNTAFEHIKNTFVPETNIELFNINNFFFYDNQENS